MKNNLKISNILIILTALVIFLFLVLTACSSGLTQPGNERSGNENIESAESNNQGNSGGGNTVSSSESSTAQESSGKIIDDSSSSSDGSGTNQETGNENSGSQSNESIISTESTSTENSQQAREEVLEKPSVKLSIIEGPEYAQDGAICYYRVKAEVAGNPAPQIIFSKDDSNGTWGSNVAQVNLTQNETYNLVCDAKNSEGSSTSSITLQWVAPDNISTNNGETSGESSQQEASIDYSNPGNFRIDVNLTAQLVSVYYKDNLIKSLRCSGGTAETPTVTGTFTTSQKIYYSWVPKFNEGAYYWVRFYGAYLFHSVPFDKNGNMIAEEASKIGTPASHGCVRFALEDAKWFYETLPLGIKVTIHY
ncbi:MAG: L,D-transpeptidase [Actinobacteria bacterium]|nr:L,D-transpeptidase [Actinomycetota bacterium]